MMERIEKPIERRFAVGEKTPRARSLASANLPVFVMATGVSRVSGVESF